MICTLVRTIARNRRRMPEASGKMGSSGTAEGLVDSGVYAARTTALW